MVIRIITIFFRIINSHSKFIIFKNTSRLICCEHYLWKDFARTLKFSTCVLSFFEIGSRSLKRFKFSKKSGWLLHQHNFVMYFVVLINNAIVTISHDLSTKTKYFDSKLWCFVKSCVPASTWTHKKGTLNRTSARPFIFFTYKIVDNDKAIISILFKKKIFIINTNRNQIILNIQI